MVLDREYRFEVKQLLRATNNEICVVIQPATAEATRRAAAYPYEVPAMVVGSTLCRQIKGRHNTQVVRAISTCLVDVFTVRLLRSGSRHVPAPQLSAEAGM